MYLWPPLLFLLFSLCAQAEQLKLDVSAASAILINAETGRVLYEKEPHLRLFPASTTKIATGLYVLEKKGADLEEVYTATADCVGVVHASIRQAADTKHPPYRLEHDGVHIGLKIGEQLSLRALLYGLMLASGNDAANVIAYYVSGSIPQFMDELNAFLASLGLAETHFNNPHGLYHPEHYTTASDMAKLSQVAMKNPLFRDIVKTVRSPRPQTNKQAEGVFIQHNRLLRPGKNYYPKAIGIKTGYTFKAGNNFVAAAEHEGRTLIAVLLKCPRMDNSFQDAIKLFDAAFSQAKVARTLFAQGYDQFSTQVKGADRPLGAVLAEDFKIEYYPAEELEYQAFLHWNDLVLPVSKGQRVGELRLITPDGKIIKAAPLYASNELERTFFTKAKGQATNPRLKGALLFLLIAAALLLFLRNRSRKPSMRK